MHFGYVVIIITAITTEFSRLSADGQTADAERSAAQQSLRTSGDVPNINSHDTVKVEHSIPDQNQGVPETRGDVPNTNSHDTVKVEHSIPDQNQGVPETQQINAAEQQQDEQPQSLQPQHQHQIHPDGQQQNGHLQKQLPQEYRASHSKVDQQGGAESIADNYNDARSDIIIEGKQEGDVSDGDHRNSLKKRETHDDAENRGTGVSGETDGTTVNHLEEIKATPVSDQVTAEWESQGREDGEKHVDPSSDPQSVRGHTESGQPEPIDLDHGDSHLGSTARPQDVSTSGSLPQTGDQKSRSQPHQPDIVVAEVTVGKEQTVAASVEDEAQTPEVVIITPMADRLQEQLQQEQRPQQQQDQHQQAPSQLSSPPPPTVQIPSPMADLGQSVSLPPKIPSKRDNAVPPGSGGMGVEDILEFEEDKVGDVEEFQTFGEWRKKVMEEELEKANEKVKKAKGNSNGETPHTAPPLNSAKLRINYASDKCGAKVTASNQEMENAKYILTASKDEYMINPCSVKKWFVVELCEPISVKQVEIASLELFSSRPKAFRLSVTDRSPAREWMDVGTYEMMSDKVPQSFQLGTVTPFVKFIKVEMLDHYGSEHFCPVTFFRVFGLPMEDEDDEDVPSATQTNSEDEELDSEPHSLFARTKDTVVKLMKKMLHTEQGQQEDHISVTEKHVNGSGGEPNMPCDPEMEQDTINTLSLVTKSVEGVKVTVHLPHPTIKDSQASAMPKEIPMVTKLEDSEQEENEDNSRLASSNGEDLVTLLETGAVTRGWNSWTLRFCHPRSHVLLNTCCYNPSCLYVEMMLRSSVPLCLKRISWAEILASTIASSSAAGDFLEPSFTSTASHLPILESTAPEVIGQKTIASIVQSSTDVVKLQTSKLTSSATMHIPDQHSADPTQASSSVKDVNGVKGKNLVDVPVQTESLPMDSDISSSAVRLAEDITVGSGGGKMVETDPGVAAASTVATEMDDASSSQGESVENESLSSAASSEKQPDDLDDLGTEILQPSVQLDTSVVSPTLARPTPVLEVSAASVEAEGGKGEVVETIMPPLSPSPTSEMPDAAEDLPESDAYPQIIMPTIEDAHSLEQTQAPDLSVVDEMPANTETSQYIQKQREDTPLEQHNTTVGAGVAEKNETERKGLDDLVHVPLSLSAKRESAIMRLTNRIKALELNVSLSSRFLEELSARFKKQNEEMMKMLNKTMNKFNTTATTSHKQALQQELRIDQLETRLDNLTTTVQNLADRFDTFAEQMSDRQMTFTTVNLLFLLFCAIIMVRVSHSKSVHPDVQFLLDTMPRRPPLVTPFQRRNSETALHTVTQQGLRKGGSVTNIASASTPGFFIFDKRDAGPKKKKRKKHKASKPLDTESVCGTDSDPGCKLSSRGSGSSSHSPKFGHRRCDSATASFPSSTETVPEGREVMFSMGGKTIHASSDKDRNNAYHSIDPDQSLSLPYMIKDQGRGGCGCPTSVGYYRSDIPHLSSRSQRSKSVSSPSSPVGLETNWFDSGVAWGESVHGVQRVGSVHRGSGLANGRRSQDDIDKVSTSSREDGREGSSTPTGFARSVASPHVPNNPTHHHHPQPPPPNQRRSSLSAKSPSWFSFWPKTKKLASAPSSVLNGERESRGRVPDPPQQKGSLGARTEDCMESGVGSSKEAGRGRGNKRSLKSNLF